MNTGGMVSLRAVVHGRVHGVFFRSFTNNQAKKLGLTGYVRDAPDGTVEVLAEGQKDKLEKLIEFIRVGPPAARVEKVEYDWADYSGKYRNFTIKYN